MGREDISKLLVVEKVAVVTTKSEEDLGAEEAEVGITEVLELVRDSGKPNKENGIDISDPTRWYEQDELSALSSATRNYVL